MTRKLAHIERIVALTPIAGADLIERAQVQGWGVVVKKGLHQVGDLVVLFEIDSLIPLRPWSSFLFKDTRELYRLKTVKLKSTLSQGLIVPIREILELAGGDWTSQPWVEGDDVTDKLGITKWEPNLPANLAGQVKGGFPHWLRKTDEPRIQGAISVLDEIKGLPLYIATKYDGTSLTCYRHEGVFGVCSRNLELREEGGDDYWAAVKAARLHETLPEGYAISAELCGPGIQGNKMGLTSKQLFVFNVWDIKSQRYLGFVDFVAMVNGLGVETVPIIATHKLDKLPTTLDEWLAFADAVKYPNGAQAEGIVVRSMDERYSPALDGRLSFKVISNVFLLKTGE